MSENPSNGPSIPSGVSIPYGRNKETPSGDSMMPNGKNKEPPLRDSMMPNGKNKEPLLRDAMMPCGMNGEIPSRESVVSSGKNKEPPLRDSMMPYDNNKETPSRDTMMPCGRNKETPSGDTMMSYGNNKATPSTEPVIPSGKNKETHEVHEFEPVYDKNSRILILGSFPSVKSREVQFYYGHPKNRFWKLLALLYKEEEPESIPEKKSFLKKHKIAVWDVIASCDITGSSDSSIRNVAVNDVKRILDAALIQEIYANGKKAESLYQKYLEPVTGRKIIGLPSTSPANAAFSLERLAEAWKQILLD